MTRTRNLSDLLDSGGDVKSGALDNAFDGAYSSLTGTPTTLSGYGITDAATAASPTFTGNATFDSSTLYVDATNNRVGIGTTGPSVSLDVLGAEIKLQNDSAKINMVRPTNSRAGYVQVYNVNGGLRYHAGVSGAGETSIAAHTFTGDASAADTTYMTILGSGNVGIGTTSPATDLHIEDTSGSPAFRMIGSTTGVCKIEFGDSDNSSIGKIEYNHSNNYIDFKVNDSVEFRMEGDGDFHADGDVVAFSTTIASDERLKENIEVVSDAVIKCQALRGVTFDWKRDGAASAGVIAQDVQEVLPEAVKQVTGMNGQEHLAVNYGALTSILIEAIKELSDRIEELEAK